MSDEPVVSTERQGQVLLIALDRPDATDAIDGVLLAGPVPGFDDRREPDRTGS